MTKIYDHIELQSVPRPVAAMAKNYPVDYKGYTHTHRRSQFLYAISGSMRLSFETASWIVPPRRAVWLPAAYPHQTGSLGALEMRTLYIEPSAVKGAPDSPRMLRVSPLLHELVLRVIEMPVEYDEDGQQGRIIEVLLQEIDWKPIPPFSLPNVRDARLLAIQTALQADPTNKNTLESWAKQLGVSSRTLTRLFRLETNLSFQEWHDHVRTYESLPWLANGKPLAEIADALGFETAWSFTAMFKRVIGITPSKFRFE
jgi:AraC-like DNA-binding protein